uniref:Uncharacterized protein n=1 Tax=Sphaerodactylus townsendi TaxID=933632 RepID=A0ACB8FQ49_9SAUR
MVDESVLIVETYICSVSVIPIHLLISESLVYTALILLYQQMKPLALNCQGLIAIGTEEGAVQLKYQPEVIIKCLTFLQEIPCSTLQRKSAAGYESIQHMIACCSFFTAKVLRSWNEYELAIVIINYGKRLLDSSQTSTQTPAPEGVDEILEDETPSRRLKSQIAAAEKVNENLEALESTLLSLTKPGQELTGEEDTLLLYPVIKNWHTKIAYKEVLKFKKSPRFLEYFVQFLLRVVNEERFSRIIEWADDIQDYLKKRNKFLLGVKRKKRTKLIIDTKKAGAMDWYKSAQPQFSTKVQLYFDSPKPGLLNPCSDLVLFDELVSSSRFRGQSVELDSTQLTLPANHVVPVSAQSGLSFS